MDKIDIKIGDIVKLKELKYEFVVIDVYSDIKKIRATNNILETTFRYDDIVEVKRPTQYKTIYKKKEPILDDAEKRYLSAIIKPFRDKISHITKYKNLGDKEYISIYYYDGKKGRSIISEMAFPNFKKGTMYKGMKQNEAYKLEELGL